MPQKSSKPHPCFCILAASVLGLLPSTLFAVSPQSTIQPSLPLTYAIQDVGTFLDLGIVDIFPTNFAPAGTQLADGHLIPIQQNTALFSKVGTLYGGDGVTTFAVPNLEGVAAIGTGQGAGLTNRDTGDITGVTQVTLTQPQLPVSAGGQGQSFTNMQPSLALNYYIETNGIFPTQGGSGAGAGGNNSPYIGQVLATAASSNQTVPSGLLPAQGQLLPINQFQALFSILGTTYGGDGKTNFALPDLRGRTAIGAGSGSTLTTRTVGQSFGSESTTLIPSNLLAPIGTDAPYNNMQPSLGLNYIIALSGIFPTRPGDGGSVDNDQPIIGQITLFAGNFAPSGWAFASGQLLPINQNTALFSLLGTNYGGDGKTNFALPDLRGRIPVGADGSQFVLGNPSGTESLTLSPSQVPAPEPASLGILALGAAALLVRHKRR